MIKNKVQQYISENKAVFKEEKEYAEKHQLVGNLQLEEKDPGERFVDTYIERCDKQTENMIRQESSGFLAQPLVYLKKHKNEFIYLESQWFDFVRVDAVSLEVDDVFGSYDVMLGLKLQKKLANPIREYLNHHLQGDEAKFDLLFSQDDGLWDLNFALNDVDGYDESMSIGEGLQLIYRFLFKLIEAIEVYGER